jgi:hypothetical protein
MLWLPAAIYHESFHAKHHFNPDKPHVHREANEQHGAEKPGMSQEVLMEEIEAYSKELSEANKLGLTDDMFNEIIGRREKLYRELTNENRDTARDMMLKKKPWPHQIAHH